jgi:hypothetical protein
MELSLNYQMNTSNRFFELDHEVDPLFNNLSTNYLFARTDFGLSERLTLSIGTGYFLRNAIHELNKETPISSSGFGDVIFFPRFNVYNKSSVVKRTEVTLGMGVKMPIGTHDDNYLIFSSSSTGDIYAYAPPTVQTTNGSTDIMLYSFLMRDYPIRKLRFFTTFLYMHKSFNSLGQKFGNYSSLGLFVGKTFFQKLGVNLQLRGEWIGRIKAAEGVDLVAKYNIDPESTGSRKIFVVPQISFPIRDVSFFITTEIPVYQYLQGTQIGSQFQLTTGINYRFLTKKEALLDS